MNDLLAWSLINFFCLLYENFLRCAFLSVWGNELLNIIKSLHFCTFVESGGVIYWFKWFIFLKICHNSNFLYFWFILAASILYSADVNECSRHDFLSTLLCYNFLWRLKSIFLEFVVCKNLCFRQVRLYISLCISTLNWKCGKVLLNFQWGFSNFKFWQKWFRFKLANKYPKY